MSEVFCRYCGRRGHGDPCAVCATAGEMYPQGSCGNGGPAPSPAPVKAPKTKRGRKR